MIKRFISRSAISVFSAAALLALPVAAVHAMPSDVAPRGSSLLDAFAALAKREDFVGRQYTTLDFLGTRQWSRAELARIVERTVLDDATTLSRAESDAPSSAALRAIVVQLRPELKLDGYDADALAASIAARGVSYDLLGKLEGRADSGTEHTKNGQMQSGAFGIYRGTVQGDIGPSARYAVSVSNWPEEYRRVFQTDLGPHDFQALQEAYIELEGRRGLRFDIGRMYDNWGPGYRGSTMLSDNSPAFNQLLLSFPFSLGRRLGRNYTFEQNATIYRDYGKTRYQEDRRIGYTFSKQWQIDFEEAFKSSDSTTLLYTPIPFDLGQGARLSTAQYEFNYQLGGALTYHPSTETRIYGQLFIDDLKSPFTSGHVFGFSVGNHDKIYQKLAYLVGFHGQTPDGATALTVEYYTADDGAYTYRNHNAVWQHGQFDWMGLPAGPDSKEFYARIDQRIGKPITLGIEFRDRRRKDDHYIAPTSRELGIDGSYQLTNRDSVGVSYFNYKQDPYPFTVGAAGSPPIITYAPPDEGNVGQRLRGSEIDFSFTHVL